MQNDRQGLQRTEVAKLPATEQAKYYQQLLRYSSTAGTYTVEGDVLRRQWVISQGPDIVGQESVARFSVKGDRLIVDIPRRSAASGPAVRVVYRRLE
jgi:hypothetical protein